MATTTDWDWVKVGIKAESVDVEDVWNPCTILKRIPQENKVRVRYDGWDSSFDEDVPLNKSHLAKLGTHTLKRKCWVKLKAKVYLPAIAFLRSATSQKGIEYLETEAKILLLIFTGKNTDFLFVEPKKCLSWSEYPRDQAPNQAAVDQVLQEHAADDYPLKFLKGIQPADDFFQIDAIRKRAKAATPTASTPSSPNGKPTSREVLESASSLSSTGKTESGSANKKMRRSNPSTPLRSPQLDQDTSAASEVDLSVAPYSLTPAERLANLAKSIEQSTKANSAVPSMKSHRALSKSQKDKTAKTGKEVWGTGSSTSQDEFSLRSWVSNKFCNVG